jgi:hypothetical protein
MLPGGGVELVAVWKRPWNLPGASGRWAPTSPNLVEEAELARMSAAGFRLACQAELLSDVRIDIPPGSSQHPTPAD